MRSQLPRKTRLPLFLLAALAGAPAWAAMQSHEASRASGASLAASAAVPVAAVEALSAGAAFLVEGLEASSQSVAITVSAVGVGASLVVYLAVETVRRLGIVAGTAVSVTVVATGWVLSVAGESLCFIASDGTRRHIHSHRISG